ncbi:MULTISPECIES: hypothetical protein [unclassified Schaalia]|uniref:hypothetical protein n=1 Tax=unclassified Schaalia TaxID=2691889 RepID=UPI001E5FDE59|nr:MULTISPECIES: hypothetical protein [unclassified Schaalia]MCD4549404.1 hypothetical protein [Schaalia sp. lx-260]MCD4557964.1 hypothetical protein [Schaalia sp. lx-100]
MLLKHRVVPALVCGFLILSVTGCANAPTQGLSGSSESTNESGESGSPHMVVVESRDEQPEISRQWFAMTREEQEKINDEEKQEIMECLKEKGWKVEKNTDYFGQLNYSIDTQGNDALFTQMLKDSEECEKLSPSPYRDLVISVPDIENYYEHDLTVKECLEKEGITVTTPPTKQKYIDDFRNDRVTWSPYTDLINASDLTADRFREITEKCPQ